MDGNDQQLPCLDCGGTFAFSATERAFYEEKGFSLPKRCAGARKARKANPGAPTRYDDGCPFGQGGGRGGSGPRRQAPRVQRPPLPGTGQFLQGEVLKTMPERGFGFLRGEDQQDYFFDEGSAAAGLSALRPGMRVSFEVVHAPKGPRAQRVELV